jgi:hydrogenase expression/formation protein HypE
LMTVDLNLPPAMTELDLEALWDSVHQTCASLGIHIVTGHTGRYEGCAFPMVGGCTAMGFGSEDAYVASNMARPGDSVIITKGAAVEAAGLMAVTFPERLNAAFGEDFARRAENIFWEMSTVKDALTAVRVGVRDRGITAMHDATECGVLGGLHEMATASKIGMRIHAEEIPVSEDIRKICTLFDMDPLTSISEGTLLITCRSVQTEAVVRELKEEGIRAAVVGECTEAPDILVSRRGQEERLEHPRVDPFWAAFARASQS